jgi:hypothetical protein
MRTALMRFPLLVVTAGTLLFASCNKKMATAPPPPPAPPAPSAALAASPDVIHPGQSALLTRQSQNATDVNN